ncbi:hypothetical protein GQ53DRAFT_379857 [Thozetella sp. PMI_491]|nr:hypothetical protein GQ53DRAFT_379857 [Thozetella sp. PMI_491]
MGRRCFNAHGSLHQTIPVIPRCCPPGTCLPAHEELLLSSPPIGPWPSLLSRSLPHPSKNKGWRRSLRPRLSRAKNNLRRARYDTLAASAYRSARKGMLDAARSPAGCCCPGWQVSVASVALARRHVERPHHGSRCCRRAVPLVSRASLQVPAEAVGPPLRAPAVCSLCRLVNIPLASAVAISFVQMPLRQWHGLAREASSRFSIRGC